MDPITHLIVNTGVYCAVSQQGINWDTPELWASSAGALIPDSDAFMQIFGDIPYLKNHRGSSHSLIGGLLMSGLIALFLSLLLSHSFLALWGYGFLGVASHLFLDWCNSYGIKLLWPFTNKMYSGNLLVVIEPVLILLSFLVIFSFSSNYASLFSEYGGQANDMAYAFYTNIGWIVLAGQVGYILARYLSRINFTNYLNSRFASTNPENIVVLPASDRFFQWDFIVETKQAVYVGRSPIFKQSYWIKEKLSKKTEQETGKFLIKKALNSKTGRLFRDFTPYFLVKHEQTADNQHQVTFIDLRYHMGTRFLHKATMRFRGQDTVEEGIFQPYHPDRKVPVE